MYSKKIPIIVDILVVNQIQILTLNSFDILQIQNIPNIRRGNPSKDGDGSEIYRILASKHATASGGPHIVQEFIDLTTYTFYSSNLN